MRKLTSPLLKVCIFLAAMAAVLVPARSSQAQSTTWQILPFPEDSNWPGYRGQPAVTNGNQVTFYGQPIRSTEVFTPPVTFSYDVVLQSRDPNASDGAFWLFLIPPGEAPNLNLTADFSPQMAYGSSPGQDDLVIQQYPPLSNLVAIPFNITPGTTYHVTLAVAANGQLTWTVNGQTYVNGNVTVPYPQFQFEPWGWQPTDVWLMNNFTVTTTPALTCPNAVGTWTGQVDVVDSRSGYRESTLSLQVTDQGTNNCLLRGYLSTGRSNSRGPWGYFDPGYWWGNVPFTGTILDTTGVILNFGIFGQASATLDTTQTPPVMRKFILLSSGGAGSGDTAVGDLTEEPSP